jgi:hypothetical protein
MTLHLTRASGQYILQVSDRLVSGGFQDPVANKNLIYWARDAIVLIGYTGLAYNISPYNPNKPTDEWIAEVLWGKPIPKINNDTKPFALSFEQIDRWLDIGQSIKLLRDELQNSFNRLPISHRKLPFEVVAVGYQLQKKHSNIYRPIIVQIKKTSETTSFNIERQKRNWYLKGRIGLATIPDGYLSKTELSEYKEKLPFASPDESERLLVELIRHAASRHPKSIGSNCISILLPRLDIAPIRIRFFPDIPHSAIFTSGGEFKYRLRVSFSPWVIGPNMVHAPSIHVGELNMQIGPFKIIIEAPKLQKGIMCYMGSLSRPTYP